MKTSGKLHKQKTPITVIEADMTFGRLTAIRSVGPDPKGDGELWEFKCSCDGRIVTFPAASVLRRKGSRKSCGCLRSENAARQGRAKRVPLRVAFLRHIDLENRPTPDPARCNGYGRCLLWNGALDTNGRAEMGIEGKANVASKVAWYLYYGYWPKSGKRGTWLCHVCDNPACVNPLHLIEGDAALNGYDRARKKAGGILQACSPPDPSSDENHEAELKNFLLSLSLMADEWEKSKAVENESHSGAVAVRKAKLTANPAEGTSSVAAEKSATSKTVQQRTKDNAAAVLVPAAIVSSDALPAAAPLALSEDSLMLGWLGPEVEPFVDAEAVAEFLSLPRREVLKLTREGRITGYAISGKDRKTYKYRLSEVARDITMSVSGPSGSLAKAA